MLPTRSPSGSIQAGGKARAPSIAPTIDPAVAPLQSVSRPQATAIEMVLARSQSPHSNPIATKQAFIDGVHAVVVSAR